MRTKMRLNDDPSKLSISPLVSASANGISQMMSNPPRNEGSSADSSIKSSAFGNHTERNFDVVKDSMDLAISFEQN
ncbi:hypothetical protein NC653_026894 [Populus alba x Populus x berolinensis]|uniref:Uncharacterized protein n=1 Tax=Populus alba x Populus x berolinensis TaxID=444605 RepID=A0AAD6M537_9ROSI|nr:hypothetical protein NC653_026894 [Populus alba x Populus x berolinensis]